MFKQCRKFPVTQFGHGQECFLWKSIFSGFSGRLAAKVKYGLTAINFLEMLDGRRGTYHVDSSGTPFYLSDAKLHDTYV